MEMSALEITWLIVQLAFWIAVCWAIFYLCLGILGLILMIPKYLIEKVFYGINYTVGLILGSIILIFTISFNFVLQKLGLKKKESFSYEEEFKESVESVDIFDPYQILEVTPDADKQEIKKAYIYQMSQYHPDKVAHLGKELQKFAEERAKNIQQAYSVIQNA